MQTHTYPAPLWLEGTSQGLFPTRSQSLSQSLTL